MGGFNPKQMQEILARAREQSEALQRKMSETIVEASAGGGAVSVKMNGQKHILSIKIDPETVKSGDLEMLQDMVMAAVNEAARQAEAAMQTTLGGMLGGMGLPGGLF